MSNLTLPEEREELINEYQIKIDKIINDGFDLSIEERNLLDRVFDVYEGKYRNIDIISQYINTSLSVTGEVKSICFEEHKCSMYIVEEDMEIILPITEDMPGWLLREGMQFSAKYSHIYGLSNIRPLRYSYMSHEEIISEIQKSFFGSDKEAIC